MALISIGHTILEKLQPFRSYAIRVIVIKHSLADPHGKQREHLLNDSQ